MNEDIGNVVIKPQFSDEEYNIKGQRDSSYSQYEILDKGSSSYSKSESLYSVSSMNLSDK